MLRGILAPAHIPATFTTMNNAMSTTNFELSNIPKWVFAIAALVVASSAAYGMVFADCTVKLFGLEFGKDRPCARAEAELVQQVSDLETGIQALERQMDTMGTRDRGKVALTVTNHGRGDIAGCPEGMFVSGIKAPGGVGGKYATDGINKIEYLCSPVATD